MFEPKTLTDFLFELAHNNNKPWFDEHHARYQDIRKNLLIFCEDVHADLVQIDPELRHMDPKKCLFRINRDIRFSNDKTPYKTHFGGKFTNDGRKKGFAGYNIIFTAHGELLLMAGIHKLPPKELNKIRDNIVNKSDFQQIILAPEFQKKFPLYDEWKLKQCPTGYDKDSPYIELLKLQSWWAIHTVPEQTWSQWNYKELKQYTLMTLAELTPFVQNLNQTLHQQV